MSLNIYDFISSEEYKEICESLKENETKIIYSDDAMDIEIKRVGKKNLTFVNTYSNKKLNEALNNVCSLV